MSVKEGIAGITAAEIELAKKRVHPIDKKDFMAGVKKAIRTKNIRINTYSFRKVNDGHMLKIKLEKFIRGTSMGTRMIKGYLSDEKKKELETLLDAIPRKYYTDSRDGSSRERPIKIIPKIRKAPTELVLADLWNTEEK